MIFLFRISWMFLIRLGFCSSLLWGRIWARRRSSGANGRGGFWCGWGGVCGRDGVACYKLSVMRINREQSK